MKFSLNIRMMGWMYAFLCADGLARRVADGPAAKWRVAEEYRRVMERAKDIGPKNNLTSAYTMGAYCIAMHRQAGVSFEDCYVILKEGFESKRGLASKFLGTGKAYVSKKKLPGRLKWAEKTHRREYPNDWVVDIRQDVTDADYAMDYTECGICKLCRDEGVPDLAKYLCKLDYVLGDLMGLALTRTTTIAEGGTCCDFRYNLR